MYDGAAIKVTCKMSSKVRSSRLNLNPNQHRRASVLQLEREVGDVWHKLEPVHSKQNSRWSHVVTEPTTPDSLRSARLVRQEGRRSLVFLNGCEYVPTYLDLRIRYVLSSSRLC